VDGKPDIIYLDIRAGLVWPYQTQPGYWLILGQYEKENAFCKHPLVLLDEMKSRNLDKLFDSITDSAVRLMSKDIYVSMDEENDCYRDAFNRYCNDHNIRRVFLNRAPYVDNFEFGIGLIREWLRDEALEIDRDTLIHEELSQIPESVLEEDQKDTYYAIHALRFVLASFVKSPWRPPLRDLDYGDWYQYPGFYKGINI
jgi:hypothetical protein